MNIAVVLASGKGLRTGMSIPKQFAIIDGKPLFLFSTLTFNTCKNIDKILLVTNKEYIDQVKQILKENNIEKILDVIPGGDERYLSVKNAINYLKDKVTNEDIVLFHDSARPLVSEEIILNNIKTCEKFGACETAIKEVNNIFKSSNNSLETPINRAGIYCSQTPQTFKFKIINESYKKIDLNDSIFYDDATIVKQSGYDVKIVEGSIKNLKVTTKEDFEIIESLIKKHC